PRAHSRGQRGRNLPGAEDIRTPRLLDDRPVRINGVLLGVVVHGRVVDEDVDASELPVDGRSGLAGVRRRNVETADDEARAPNGVGRALTLRRVTAREHHAKAPVE